MAQYIGTTVITSVIAGTNCSGGGTSGAVTVNVDDAFLVNDASDTTTGTITAGGFTTTGTWTFDEFTSGTIGITTVQDSGTNFDDNDTSLMTAAAVSDYVLGLGYSAGDMTGVDLTGGIGISIDSETNTTSGAYSSTITCNLEGTELISTGEGGGTKFLREDGDGTCSWQTAGGGGISWDGSTANGIATYKDADEATVEANLTFDGSTLSVEADANTTANAINIDANSLTTGTAINVDVDDALATSAAKSLILVDYDKVGNTASGQTSSTTGLSIGMNDNATDNVGNINMTGIDVVVDSADADGTVIQTGMRVTCTDGDAATTYGYVSGVEDGGIDFIAVSTADASDYFSIATTANGATTLTTVDAGAAAANFEVAADGNITLDAAGDIALECGSGDLTCDGLVTVTNASGVVINDATTSSATEGGNLVLAADDGAVMGSGHRLGVIEFKGAEDTSNTLTVGARVEAITKAAWDASNNDAKLSFYTGYDDAQQAEKVDIGGNTAMSVHHDYHATTFENQLTADRGGGTILKYSPGGDESPAGSELFFLHTDGTWNQADADAVATGGSQLLAVGLGASARTTGVLLEGFVRIASTEILNTPGAGAVDGLPLYVSTTAGHFDFTAPSGSGDFVRVVGYAIDDDSSDVLVYFKPDSTCIELA